MKTEDIKKMAQAWKAVQEASKLDPVNQAELKGTHAQRKDKDINNDDKVDSTDKYLHTRRKAVSHAMKEEAEQLDEIGDTPAGKKKLKNLIVNRTQKAVDAGASLERRPEKAAQYDKAQKRHMKTIGRAAERLAKEEVELDEDISKMSDSRLKWHMNTGVPHGSYTKDEMKKERDRRLSRVDTHAAYKKAKPMMEEVEELDEAVEVSHDRYMRSHGKKASGGEGSWMFTHKRMGDANVNDPKEVHSARGKFSDAKKSAQQWAKKHGHSTVYVMEEVEQIAEISRDTARSYIRKAMAHKTTGETPKKDRSAGIELAGKKAYGMTGKAKVNATEAADLNAANADKAMRHDCATHVEHAEWGRGQPIKGEHTIVETSEGEGYVTHYDVMFEHGIEKNVAVEDLKILASESHMHANRKKKMKESNQWPVYSRILEKRDAHTKGATAAEPIDSKASQGEKDFVAKHGGLTGNDSGIDGAKAAADTAKAIANSTKTAPKRPADATIGDKTMPKA